MNRGLTTTLAMRLALRRSPLSEPSREDQPPTRRANPAPSRQRPQGRAPTRDGPLPSTGKHPPTSPQPSRQGLPPAGQRHTIRPPCVDHLASPNPTAADHPKPTPPLLGQLLSSRTAPIPPPPPAPTATASAPSSTRTSRSATSTSASPSSLTVFSKFPKVSRFSSVNNLYDLTLGPRYPSLCGYTDHHLDTVFAPELPGLDRDRIREWYNGYSWGGDEHLYNLYDVLLLFDQRDFPAWWFETGTPQFLPDLLVRRNVSTLDLEDLTADESLLSAFDIDDIGTEALLFQTGYLTVTDWSKGDDGTTDYRLEYPNREVRLSLNRALLSSLVNSLSKRLTHCRNVAKHIRAGDFEQLNQALHAFFASIPHAWYRNSRIERYEGYYARSSSPSCPASASTLAPKKPPHGATSIWPC